MFLLDQGYGISKSTFYQDNQNSIKMQIKDINYCTGSSGNINIRYLFVKEKVDKGEVKIEYIFQPTKCSQISSYNPYKGVCFIISQTS